MPKVGLGKGDFSESKVAKLSKEPQVPLGGIIGKDRFGGITFEKLWISKNQWKNNDTMEAQNDVEEDDNVFVENDKFGIYDIVD
jgi:hypothetical protein